MSNALSHPALRQAEADLRRPPSFWTQFVRNPQTLVGGIIVAAIVLIAVLAPILAPYDPNLPNPDQLYRPPSPEHIMGTDEIGRDILSRMIYGARISLTVGLATMLLSGFIGISLGAIGGYFGGRIDAVIVQLSDTFQAIPGLVLAIGILAVLGAGLSRVVLAISLVSWVAYARIVRGSYLSLKEQQFVEAARATGVRTPTIIVRHILPNAIGPIVVILTLNVAGAILTEASLGYLGLGVSAPTATWGSMLVQGQRLIRVAPHVAIFPGLAIFLTALSFNMLGEGLRDILDPATR
ncbi:MAG: ABC transporter permease [Anaerolineae bacterium]|nr:ABC transporter permease [Anaerolineae bacterium]